MLDYTSSVFQTEPVGRWAFSTDPSSFISWLGLYGLLFPFPGDWSIIFFIVVHLWWYMDALVSKRNGSVRVDKWSSWVYPHWNGDQGNQIHHREAATWRNCQFTNLTPPLASWCSLVASSSPFHPDSTLGSQRLWSNRQQQHHVR